ncbi:MAG TPA: hypothetical protein VHF07_05175, partial [Nitrospiraceae bacterium]|nr:hypothetical protein [Nitrospiraceae bacterium]
MRTKRFFHCNADASNVDDTTEESSGTQRQEEFAGLPGKLYLPMHWLIREERDHSDGTPANGSSAGVVP